MNENMQTMSYCVILSRRKFMNDFTQCWLFSLPYYLAKNNMHSSTMHEKRTTYTCFFSAIFLESSSRVFLHTNPRYAYFFKDQAHEIALILETRKTEIDF